MSVQPLPPYHTIIQNRYSGESKVIDYAITQAEWDAIEAAGWYYGSVEPPPITPPPTNGNGSAMGCATAIIMVVATVILVFSLISII